MIADLERTFELLSRSRQAAALDLLLRGLDSSSPGVRRLAVRSIVQRAEDRGLQALIGHWMELDTQDIELLTEHDRRLTPAIIQLLSRGDVSARQAAVAAAQRLQVPRAIPALLDLAEQPEDPASDAAARAVLHLAVGLGRAARQDRDTPSQRAPLLERLATSVRRFPQHRNDRLVDAFLSAVRWEDGCLTSLLAEDEPACHVLAKRFESSDHPAVIQLLAGWVRKHRIPAIVQRALRERDGRQLRDELLTCVGEDPSGPVLRQLQSLGTPACCRPVERLFIQLPRTAWPAAVHLIAASETDGLRTLRMLLDALDLGDPRTKESAIRELQKLAEIDPQVWLRGAAELGEPDAGVASQLLGHLLRWLRVGDERLQAAIRGVLSSLHLEPVLPLLETLRPATRRQLGKITRLVDLEAVNRLGIMLRHPVLAKRLQAIEGVLALEATDEVLGQLLRMVEMDYAEARAAAVMALRQSRSPHAVNLLQRLRLDDGSSDGPSAAPADDPPVATRVEPDQSAVSGDVNPPSATSTSPIPPARSPAPLLHGIALLGGGPRLPWLNQDFQLTFLAMSLALAIGAGWCVWQRGRARRRSPQAAGYRLWLELCHLHRLSRRDRAALHSAALTVQAEQPGLLMVLPELFDQAIDRTSDPRTRTRLLGLRQKLFE